MASNNEEEEARLEEESPSKQHQGKRKNRDLSDANDEAEKKSKAKNQEAEKSTADGRGDEESSATGGKDEAKAGEEDGAEESKATEEDSKQAPAPPVEQQQAAAIAAALGNPLFASGMPLAAMASPQANFNPFLFTQAQGQFPFGFPMQNLQGLVANRPGVAGNNQQHEGEQPQEEEQQSRKEGQQGQEEGAGTPTATSNGQGMSAPFNAAALQQLYGQQGMDAAQMMMMGFPAGFAGNPFMSALRPDLAGRLEGMPLANLANSVFRSPAVPLSLPCDDEHLSEYQILVRQQLELFEAQQEDVDSNTQGRKKGVVPGQVGLRCRHCAHLPIRQRGKGAIYYPTKLSGIYQSAQNMASSHLSDSCQCIDDRMKVTLVTLRQRKDTASGGKQYWADGAKTVGLYETEDGLRFSRQPMQPQTLAPSQNVAPTGTGN